MQDYLQNKKITIKQAQIIFRSRCRMTLYWQNFKGWKFSKICPLCNNPSNVDSQSHSFQCEIVKNLVVVEGDYRDIFEYTVSEEIAKTVEKIEKVREIFLPVS